MQAKIFKIFFEPGFVYLFSFIGVALLYFYIFTELLSIYLFILNLLKNFIDFINAKHLFNKNDLLLIAVSGGVDSCVLCHLCKQAGFDFKIAHCNFQLRGEESQRDEDFVRSLGEKYGVEVFVKKFDTKIYAEEKKVSIQVAARELRYAWFYELITNHQLLTNSKSQTPNPKLRTSNYVLTAHHTNDNIETLLMNFFKGTGMQGLKGIEVKAGRQSRLIRPLLFAKRTEIEQYAAEQQLQFVKDSSNDDEKYTRNYFRHQLIPAIQKVFPQVEYNLVNNIKRFQEISLLYNQSIELYKKKLIIKKDNEIHIPALRLLQLKGLETVLYEIIKPYGFVAAQVTEVIKLLKSSSGKYVQSASHKIIKNRNWLIISPIETSLNRHILIENATGIIDFEQGKLKFNVFSKENFTISKEDSIAQLDADKIQFPLLLRKWKQGDYFYPLGMQKKKKLSRFFIDKKLSIMEKEKTWVLEMDKKILWVVGLRIDDRFKITESTQNLLSIVLTHA